MALERLIGVLSVMVKANTAAYEAGMSKSARETVNAQKAVKAAERDFFALTRQIQNAGRAIQDVGRTLTIGITLPLAAAGGMAVKTAVSWESAFAGVRKTVNASAEELRALGAELRSMATTTGTPAEKLAGIAQSAGQLGIAKQSIAGFTKVVADLAVTTNLTAEQGAQDLARLANITQMPQTQFSNLGSTIVALGNNFATTESEIVAMALRLAGAGNSVGLTQAQVLGLATSLSSVGIEAEAGGSAFSRVMKDMAVAVSKGGDELRNFALVAAKGGVQDFAKVFREDAARAIGGFVQGLVNIRREGGDVIGLLERMGITEIRMSDALLRTAGAGDLAARSMSMAGEAWQKNSALQAEAAVRYATTEQRMKALREKVADLGRTIGGALLPAINSAIGLFDRVYPVVQRGAEGFARLPGPVQLTAVGLLGVAAAAGPATYALGSLITTTGGALRVLQEFGILARLSPGLMSAAGSFTALKAAAGPAVAQLGQAITSTAGLTAASVAAAGVVGGVLGTALLRHGDALRGVSDHTRRAAEDTGLLEGAWILLSDAARGIGGLLLDQAKGFLALAQVGLEAVGRWAGQFPPLQLALDVLKLRLDELRWAWDQVAQTASLGGDLFYQAGRALYDQGEGADQAAARTKDLAEASKVAGYDVRDWDTALLLVNSHLTELPPQLARNDQAVKEYLQTLALAKRDFLALNDVLLKAMKDGGVKPLASGQPGDVIPKPPSEAEKRAAEKAAREAAEWAKKVKDQVDALSGKKAAEELRLIVAALAGLPPGAQLARGELQALQRQLEGLAGEGTPGAAETLQKVDELLVVGVPAAKDYSAALAGLAPAAGEAATGQVAWFQATKDSIEAARDHIRAEQGRAAEIKAVAAEMLAAGQLTQEEFDQITGKTKAAEDATVSWSERLRDLAAAFQVLGISGKSGLGQLLGGLTAGAAALEQLKTAGTLGGKEGVGFSLGNLFKGSDGKVGLGSILSGITGALGAASAAISVGKAVFGLFHKSPVEKAAEQAGRFLGQKVSDKLAQAILDDAKKLGVSIQTATLLHLTEALDEAGRSVGSASAQVGALFAGIARGSVPAARGVEELGKLFSKAGDEAAAIGKAYNASTVAMIQAARQTGITFPGMAEAVAAGLDKVIAGFEKLTLHLEDGKYLGGLDPRVGVDADQVEAFGRAQGALFVDSFWVVVGERGLVAGADAFRKTLGQLRESFKDLFPPDLLDGLLGPVERIMALTEPGGEGGPAALFRGAAESASALKDIIDGLAQSGYLTAESLANSGLMAQNAYQQALQGGATEKEALLAIKPLIQANLDAASAYGLELDDNTKRLKEQAEASGMTFKVDPMMQMVDLLKVIAQALGAELPASVTTATASFGQLGDAGERAAGDVSKSFAGLGEDVAASGAQASSSFAESIEAGLARAVSATSAAMGDMTSSTETAWARADSVAQAALGAMQERLDGLARGVVVPIQWRADGGFTLPGPELPAPPEIPRAAKGLYTKASPGGSLIVSGEAGRDEITAPVDAVLQRAFTAARGGPAGVLDVGPIMAMQRELVALRAEVARLGDRPIAAAVHLDGRELAESHVEQLAAGNPRLEGAVRRAAAGQRKG